MIVARPAIETGDRADEARTLELDPFDRHPDQRGGRRREVGDQHRIACGLTGGEGRAGVEAVPADPEQGRADHDEDRRVRRTHFMREVLPLADEYGEDERRGAGRGVHHKAASEIAHALLEQPAARSPDPVGDRRIDQQHPERGEDQHGRKSGSFGIGADDQRRGDDGERHLEHDEDGLGQRPGLARRGDPVEEGLAEPAPEGVAVAAIAERDRVAGNDPEHRHQAGDHHALAEHRQDVLRLHEAAIEQRQRGQRHSQDKGSGGQHPGCVAGIGFGKGGRGDGERAQQRGGRPAAGLQDGHGVLSGLFARRLRGVAHCLGVAA